MITTSDVQINKVKNGFVVSQGGNVHIAKDFYEVIDLLSKQFGGAGVSDFMAQVIPAKTEDLNKVLQGVQVVKTEEYKNLLKKVESDLYHICKFNVGVKSSSLLELKAFMRERGIEERD